MNFNQVVLAGNLVADPKQAVTQQGTIVANITLAINEKYKTATGESKEDVCFIDAVAFGRVAEIICQYCKKGNSLLISGRLKQDKWEKDGQKHSRHKVTVSRMQFIGVKPENSQNRPETGSDEGEDTHVPF